MTRRSQRHPRRLFPGSACSAHAAWFICCALLAAPAATAHSHTRTRTHSHTHFHPEHESLAQVEWVPESATLEVALRVDARHLEETLRPVAGRRVDLERLADADDVVVRYLRDRFQVRARGGANCPLTWVGHELEGPDAWLYFEVDLSDARGAIEMRNTVLFERLPRQINTVVVTASERRGALFFTVREDGFKQVDVIEPEAGRWFIAYQRRGDEGYTVMAAELDGSGARPLGPRFESDPAVRAGFDAAVVIARTADAAGLALRPDGVARGVVPDAWRGPGDSICTIESRDDGSGRLVVERSGRRTVGPWHARVAGPRWSADGRFVAASIENGAEKRIGVLDVRRGIERRVSLETPSGDPAWSPDGRFLACTTEPAEGGTRVVLVEMTTGEARTIGVGRRPAWDGAGDTLFVERPEGIVRIDRTGRVVAIVAPPGSTHVCLLDRTRFDW